MRLLYNVLYTDHHISEDSSPVARQWFMLFVYAVLVWLVGCALIAGMMCYRSRQTANQKPLPVDRNGENCSLFVYQGTVCVAPAGGQCV